MAGDECLIVGCWDGVCIWVLVFCGLCLMYMSDWHNCGIVRLFCCVKTLFWVWFELLILFGIGFLFGGLLLGSWLGCLVVVFVSAVGCLCVIAVVFDWCFGL